MLKECKPCLTFILPEDGKVRLSIHPPIHSSSPGARLLLGALNFPTFPSSSFDGLSVSDVGYWMWAWASPELAWNQVSHGDVLYHEYVGQPLVFIHGDAVC